MLVLAIDSATPTAGVALLENGKILYEAFVNYKLTHSETLMPMIDQALTTCEKKISDCSVLAVTIGPGSFTGLRIGLAAVKGLSLAYQIPVVGVSTLELLACNVMLSEPLLVAPLLNARKQEVYCAFYDCNYENKIPVALSAEMALSPEDFITKSQQYLTQTGYEKILLLGDGTAPYQDIFFRSFGSKIIVAPVHQRFPRAAALAVLAEEHLKDNPLCVLDIQFAKPTYIRLSEAESRLGQGEL